MPHRKVDTLDVVADRLEETFDKLQAVPTDIPSNEFLHRRFDVLQDGLIKLIIDLQKSAIASKRKRR